MVKKKRRGRSRFRNRLLRARSRLKASRGRGSGFPKGLMSRFGLSGLRKAQRWYLYQAHNDCQAPAPARATAYHSSNSQAARPWREKRARRQAGVVVIVRRRASCLVVWRGRMIGGLVSLCGFGERRRSKRERERRWIRLVMTIPGNENYQLIPRTTRTRISTKSQLQKEAQPHPQHQQRVIPRILPRLQAGHHLL
jgi:hypothetical protein